MTREDIARCVAKIQAYVQCGQPWKAQAEADKLRAWLAGLGL